MTPGLKPLFLCLGAIAHYLARHTPLLHAAGIEGTSALILAMTRESDAAPNGEVGWPRRGVQGLKPVILAL